MLAAPSLPDAKPSRWGLMPMEVEGARRLPPLLAPSPGKRQLEHEIRKGSTGSPYLEVTARVRPSFLQIAAWDHSPWDQLRDHPSQALTTEKGNREHNDSL